MQDKCDLMCMFVENENVHSQIYVDPNIESTFEHNNLKFYPGMFRPCCLRGTGFSPCLNIHQFIFIWVAEQAKIAAKLFLKIADFLVFFFFSHRESEWLTDEMSSKF